MPKIHNFVTPSTQLLTQMLPAVFTSLLQYAFKIYLMDNIKRMLGTDFALTVCKMSSSNSREFGMHSFLIGIASPQFKWYSIWHKLAKINCLEIGEALCSHLTTKYVCYFDLDDTLHLFGRFYIKQSCT